MDGEKRSTRGSTQSLFYDYCRLNVRPQKSTSPPLPPGAIATDFLRRARALGYLLGRGVCIVRFPTFQPFKYFPLNQLLFLALVATSCSVASCNNKQKEATSKEADAIKAAGDAAAAKLAAVDSTKKAAKSKAAAVCAEKNKRGA